MSIDQLVARFSNPDIETPNDPYHILNFQYPAVNLLPPGEAFYVDPPQNIPLRDKPPRNPKLLGMLDVNSYTMIPTASNPEPARGSKPHEELMTAVGRLSFYSGTSSLKIVSWWDESYNVEAVAYRFRLDHQMNEEWHVGREFFLSSKDMCALLAHAGEYQWIRLVKHLTSRESDRAYYHVLSNMRSVESQWEDPNFWFEDWGARSHVRVAEVFRSKFVYKSRKWVNTVEAAEVEMKCGHIATVPRALFDNPTVEACFAAKCQWCFKPILDERDAEQYMIREETRMTAEFLKENQLWVKLDHEIEDGKFSFDAHELFTALEMSLRSLSPPRGACPPGFSFGAYPATKAILKAFRSDFENSEDAFEATGKLLIFHLYQKAVRTKLGSSEVPLGQAVRRPGFDEELNFWLRRAVNLTIASCKVKSQESEDSILQAMGAMNLQGATVGSIGELFEKMGI